MSGELQDGGRAALDAAIDDWHTVNPVGSAGHRRGQGEIQRLYEQRHGTESADGRTSVQVPDASGDVQPSDISAAAETPPEPGTAEYVAESMEKMGPEVAAIATEWGGPQSTDFRENMGYLKSAVEHVTRDDPELAKLLNAEFEDEHGNVIRLGNHPNLIRAAALFGRLLAHRGGLEVAGLRSSAGKGKQSAHVSGVDQIGELTSQIFDARIRGDNMTAARLSRQRDALASKVYGDAPADGRMGA